MSLKSIFMRFINRPDTRPIADDKKPNGDGTPDESASPAAIEPESENFDVNPINPGAYPRTYSLLINAIETFEEEERTKKLKWQVCDELNSRIKQIVEDVVNKKILIDVAVYRLNALSGFDVDETNLIRNVKKEFSQSAEYDKKAVIAGILEKLNNPWIQIMDDLYFGNESDRNFWISYLKSMSDDDLRKYFLRLEEGGIYQTDEGCVDIAVRLQEIRNPAFLIDALALASRKLENKVKTQKRGLSSLRAIQKIALVLIDNSLSSQIPVSYNYVEQLYRSPLKEIKHETAKLLIKHFKDKAVSLFSDLASDDSSNENRLGRFYAIQHYALAVQEGAISQSEGIKFLENIVRHCDDGPILAIACESISNESCFDNEGRKTLVSLAKEEIDLVASEVRISSQGGSSKKKLVPLKLAVIIKTAPYSESSFSALKDIFSLEYKDDALVTACSTLNGFILFHVESDTSKTKVNYSLTVNEKVFLVELISEVGLDNLFEWIGSKDENLSKNTSGVFEWVLNNSSDYQIANAFGGKLRFSLNNPKVYEKIKQIVYRLANKQEDEQCNYSGMS